MNDTQPKASSVALRLFKSLLLQLESLLVALVAVVPTAIIIPVVFLIVRAIYDGIPNAERLDPVATTITLHFVFAEIHNYAQYIQPMVRAQLQPRL
ncbi:hypothetical protein HDU96_010421 [Phlyctochytrium bullatum]|nr:hypothetical protein HDU96_010421 [Phlyctochytrium bullatum]